MTVPNVQSQGKYKKLKQIISPNSNINKEIEIVKKKM